MSRWKRDAKITKAEEKKAKLAGYIYGLKDSGSIDSKTALEMFTISMNFMNDMYGLGVEDAMKKGGKI